MTIESAAGFVQKLGSDPDLRSQVESLGKEELLKLASEGGYNFTIEELEDVCEYISENEGEIDIEELEGVVGGSSFLNQDGIPYCIAHHTPVGAISDMGKRLNWW